MFQTILSNFDFFFLLWMPPLPTITDENEISPDLAWYKLGPKKLLGVFFFKSFVQCDTMFLSILVSRV